MVYRKNQRKKSLMVCIVFIMLFILGVTAGTISYAYFSDSAKAENTLNFGKLVVEINGTASTNIFILGKPSSENNGLLGVGDTIDFKGVVGLEEDSVNAFVRMKLENFRYYQSNLVEATIRPSDSDRDMFVTKFLTAVADSTKAGTQQHWALIDNYLYYGKMMEAGKSKAYTFNSSIAITENFVPDSFLGLTVQFDLIVQAIQTSGALDAKGEKIDESVKVDTISTTTTAKAISSITMWSNEFPEGIEPLTGSLEDLLKVGILNEKQKIVIVGPNSSCPNEYVIPSYVRKSTETNSSGCPIWYSVINNYKGLEDDNDIYKVVKISRNLKLSGTNYVEDTSVVLSFPSGMTRVVVPKTVTTIVGHTFNGCSKLKSVIFSKNVEIIDNGTFYGCSSLTSFDISSSVTHINYNAFANCTALKTINYDGTQKQWEKVVVSAQSIPGGVKVVCCDGIITI